MLSAYSTQEYLLASINLKVEAYILKPISYTKIKEATDAKLATQFLQVEIYTLSIVRNTIFKEMPFVGEEKKEEN